jgi:DNA mismatch repair ATPase MutS
VIRECIILTGYNGAGKSTLLRSVGLLVILGSLGCDVPCRFMKFKPFNEIHCRMGAYDNIRESTFYTELKEVRNMIDKKNSLLLIDELGRGTSSIDGHAIAYGILKYLLK